MDYLPIPTQSHGYGKFFGDFRYRCNHETEMVKSAILAKQWPQTTDRIAR